MNQKLVKKQKRSQNRNNRKKRNYARRMRNENDSKVRGLLFKINHLSHEIAARETKIASNERDIHRSETLRKQARAEQACEANNREKYHELRQTQETHQ